MRTREEEKSRGIGSITGGDVKKDSDEDREGWEKKQRVEGSVSRKKGEVGR